MWNWRTIAGHRIPLWIRQRTARADDLNLPLVATNAVRYATPAEYEVHDALTCSRLRLTVCEPHPARPVNDCAFLCDEKRIRRAGIREDAIANTEEIAARCNVNILPGFVTPPRARIPRGFSAHGYLLHLCKEGFKERYPEASGSRERAKEVLKKELRIIGHLKLDEFFLVVREIMDFARTNGIRCSGRGSAANSIVAFLLHITEVDPVRHNLLFERFLHEGRRSMPDIDCDFETHRRQEVIAWMAERFTESHTAMTANVVTFRSRMAVREMAKVVGFPPTLIDKASKVIPHYTTGLIHDYREDLAAALGDSPALDTVLDKVHAIRGCPRHLSLHSGGMILSRKPLRYITPIQTSANGVRQAQFSKDDVEALGLIKFDVLGIRMLSVISTTMLMLKSGMAGDVQIPDIDNLPEGDDKTYKMIRAGHTLAVFQIESPGQFNLLSRSQPENFDDLVVQVALFRPGPLQGNMVTPYVEARRGLREPKFMHPSLRKVLKDTQGIVIFQEQVLEIAHQFAGLSLTEADEFRRLMSRFRDPGEMENMREKFVQGAQKKWSAPAEVANRVFDVVAKFVGYGFCRSHAAAFARIVYQSAYLKAHFPAPYLAAFMEHRPGFYPLQSIVEEARGLGVPVLPPDVNKSMAEFTLEWIPNANGRGQRPAIRVPLSQVKGLSVDDAKNIVLGRGGAAYESLDDLLERVPLERDSLEMLARSGALSPFGKRRDTLWKVRQSSLRKRSAPGQGVLPFGNLLDAPVLEELPPYETISWDFETHDFTTGPHPVAFYRPSVEKMDAIPIRDLAERRAGRRLRIAGAVVSRQRPPTAKGMVFMILQDETGLIPTAIVPQVAERLGQQLRAQAMLVEGILQDGGQGAKNKYRSLLIDRIWPMESILGGYAGHPGQMAR